MTRSRSLIPVRRRPPDEGALVPAVQPDGRARAVERFAGAIVEFVARIPKSRHRRHRRPAQAARSIANAAAAKAAMAAGSLALPPGPLGWLTILPEMMAVWRIQAQMVADIAAVYGKSAQLTREQMLYSLFRHTAAQAVRDMVVRVGERILVRQMPQRVLNGAAGKIAQKLVERVVGNSVSRWLPVAGAIGVGAYAYFDTGQVAATAIELFEREIDLDPARVVEAE
ncbi:MAG TPA: hypothetical protein PKA20_10385 [Burkholderiaceae bacterium]|nr:hypothetical protein [Burkholderiaceae bacterium]